MLRKLSPIVLLHVYADLLEKYPKIFWSSCDTHNMLRKIGNLVASKQHHSKGKEDYSIHISYVRQVTIIKIENFVDSRGNMEEDEVMEIEDHESNSLLQDD